MLSDIWAIVLKEWKMLFLKRGNKRNTGFTSVLFSLGLIGIFLPIQMQEAWVTEPIALFSMAWTPIFWALGIITSAFAGEREAHTLETLLASRLSDTAILIGKMLSAILYGWGLMLISTLIGVVFVNIVYIEGSFQFYQWDVFLGMLVFVFLASTLFSSLGVLVSLKAPTARQAYQRLSISMFVLYIIPMMVLSFLPDDMKVSLQQWLDSLSFNETAAAIAALGILLLVDVVLFLVAKARFQRSKLILA